MRTGRNVSWNLISVSWRERIWKEVSQVKEGGTRSYEGLRKVGWMNAN